jgi:hypothetical protein
MKEWLLILYCFMPTGEVCSPATQESVWPDEPKCEFMLGYTVTVLAHSYPGRVFAGKCVPPNGDPDDEEMIYPQERT